MSVLSKIQEKKGATLLQQFHAVLLRNNDQVKFHHSKLSSEDKSSALQSLAAGNSIVATYGMAVGLNIMVKGEPVTYVDVVGTRHFLCRCVMLESQLHEQECLGAHLPLPKQLDGFGMAEKCEFSSSYSIKCIFSFVCVCAIRI
jgi:hypothetical protein